MVRLRGSGSGGLNDGYGSCGSIYVVWLLKYQLWWQKWLSNGCGCYDDVAWLMTLLVVQVALDNWLTVVVISVAVLMSG